MSADDVEDLGKSPPILRAYRERSGPPRDRKDQNWAAITAAVGTPPALPPESALAPTKSLGWGGLVGLASLGLTLAIGGALWATRSTSAPATEPPSAAPEVAALAAPEEPAAPSAPSVESAPTPRSADPAPPPEPISARRAAPRGTSTPAASSDEPVAAAPTPSTLGDEVALLAEARRAVARGDGSAALDALERHAERFSSGALAPDRELLRISALCLLHRRPDAERVAAAIGPSPATDRAVARCGAP